MQPTTPTGSRVTSERLMVSSKSKLRAVSGTPAVVAAGMPAWIIVESVAGMPTSLEMRAPISSARAASPAPSFSMKPSRSSSERPDHSGKAALAAATAASTSAAVPSGTEPMTASLDGLTTSMLPSPADGAHFPLT